MDRLVNSFLDGDIERPAYLKKKDELLRDRVELNEQKTSFEKKGALWFELARDFIETTQEATSVLESENLVALRAFVKKIGSNRILMDKKAHLSFEPPWDIVLTYKQLWDVDCGKSVYKKKGRANIKSDRPILSG